MSDNRRQTIRLVLHVPRGDSEGLAAWALTSVVDGGAVPVGEVYAHGYVPLRGSRITESTAWRALLEVCEQHVVF